MKPHAEIISEAGGYKALAEKLGLPGDRVRFWERRGSIPTDWWAAVADADVASLNKLADATDARKARA